MTKNKNKKSLEAAKQEAFKLSDGICYCKTPAAEPSNTRARIIMEHTLQMAARLQIPTVTEGIETKEQAELARDLGSIYGQGYFYGKPMPVEEFHTRYILQ